MSDPDFRKLALMKFAETLEKQGLANPNTARSHKVAVSKILDDDTVDVREIDVPLAVRRFNNKNPGQLSPASLSEYEKRVTALIREFAKYQEDPSAYKGFGRGVSTTPKKEKSVRAVSSVPAVQPAIAAGETPPPLRIAHAAARSGLSFDFPLRPDFLAQLVIPRDLKSEEAKRLCSFVMTLATDFRPDG